MRLSPRSAGCKRSEMHKNDAISVFRRGRYYIPPPIRCRPGFGVRNSASWLAHPNLVQGFDIINIFVVETGFSGVDEVLFP